MMGLGRTLPVSAVLHAAAGLVLFLVPSLSPEALPESQGPRSEVLMPAVIVPVRTSARLPTSGSAPRRRTSLPVPVGDPPPTVEPATVADDRAGLIIGERTAEPGGGPEGLGPTGPDSAGPGGDGIRPIGSPGPVRPGGDLQPPTKRRHVAPAYPDLARRAGVEGVVVLECVIDPSGRVAEVKVLRSHPLLEGAAVEAVRQWVYSPTRLNGVPVAVLLTVTVQFRLPR